jgi:hypothetical protein
VVPGRRGHASRELYLSNLGIPSRFGEEMQPINAIEEVWRGKRRTGPFHCRVTMTDTGLMLGREIILARPTADASAPRRHFINEGDETRVLALLTAAFGRPVANHAISKMRRASQL